VKNFFVRFLISCSCLLLLPEVLACDIITARDTSSILDVAKSFGSASLDKDRDGDPMIVGRAKGYNYGITFHNCQGGKCDDILLVVPFKSKQSPSLSKINTWNRTKRFGKAYLDRDGDPIIDVSINLDYGICKENLEDTFAIWMKVIHEFEKEMTE